MTAAVERVSPTLEQIARVIDPDAWAHVDGCHEAMRSASETHLKILRSVIDTRLRESGSITTAERVQALYAPILSELDRLSAALGEAREAIDGALSHCSATGYLNCGKPATDKLRSASVRARTALQQQEARDGRE